MANLQSDRNSRERMRGAYEVWNSNAEPKEEYRCSYQRQEVYAA